ncbi:MAG TPA: fenitrothion hydrolase, partial [Capillimicrobium sp.]
GRWPAAIGLIAFAWLELVSVNRDDPSLLAVLMLAYAAIQLVGMSLYGVDPWLRNGDAFGAWFGLVARMAPLHWRDRALAVRRPLAGLPSLQPRAGTVALVCVSIGVTAFDGLSQGRLWNDVAPELQRVFIDIGLSASTSLQLAFTIGLLLAIAMVFGFYRAGVAGMPSPAPGVDARELGRRFAHTLVPIAFAYVVAHYFSLLAFQGQAMAYLVSDPLGDGSDLLGTADAAIDYRWLSSTAVQYIQVAALIAGHVAGLALAHDRAIALYRDRKEATRSQYWMLVVMIAFTGLGMWLLSEAAQ